MRMHDDANYDARSRRSENKNYGTLHEEFNYIHDDFRVPHEDINIMKNLIIYNYYIWFTFESTNHRLFDEHSYYSNWHSLSSNSFGCTFFRGTVRGPSVVGGGFTIITEQEQRIVLEEEKNETNQTQHRRMLFTLLFKKSMKNDRLFAVN